MPTVNVATFLKVLESAPKDADANDHTDCNKEIRKQELLRTHGMELDLAPT